MMELPVAAQAAQFGKCLLLGAVLGGYYDLLRAKRRVRPRRTHLLDLRFVLVAFVCFLLFALYVGQGRFRLFFLPGLALGAAAYFCLLSKPLLRVWLALFRRLQAGRTRCILLLRKAFSRIQKLFCDFSKKVLHSSEKKGSIHNRHKFCKRRRLERSEPG